MNKDIDVKVIKLDAQLYGLAISLPLLGRANELNMQRIAIDHADMYSSKRLQDMTRGLASALGVNSKAMDLLNTAHDRTNNEDALRSVEMMKKKFKAAQEEIGKSLETL